MTELTMVKKRFIRTMLDRKGIKVLILDIKTLKQSHVDGMYIFRIATNLYTFNINNNSIVKTEEVK